VVIIESSINGPTIEDSKPILPNRRVNDATKDYLSDGIDDTSVIEFTNDNEWPDEIAFGWDYVDRRIAARLVFVYEKSRAVENVVSKYNLNTGPGSSRQDRAIYDQMIKEALEYINGRAFAKHPKLEGYFAFPYILVKYNPQMADLNTDFGEDNFRDIIRVRNEYDRFIIRPKLDLEGTPVTDWNGTFGSWEKNLENAGHYKFQVARDIYQMRNVLAVDESFLEYYRTVDIDPRELYYNIKQKFLYFVDMPEEWATLSALWVMGTHIFLHFTAFPYVYLLGPQDTGKTRWMKVACQMSHRGRLELNPTGPAIFREVDSTQSTLFIDEVDKIDFTKFPDIRAILNSGYETGFDVPRMNMDLKMLEHFKTFSPKCLGSNRPLDSILTSRALRVPLQRTPNAKKFVKREPMMPEYLTEFREIMNELKVWAIDTACALATYDKTNIEKKWDPIFEELLAPPRLKQIMNPLLMIYDILKLDEPYGSYSPSETNNIRKIVSYLIDDSKMSTLPETDMRVISGLYYACFMPSNLLKCATKLDKQTDALLIGNEQIRNCMHLETKEDQKKFSARYVGDALSKYAVPKRKTRGVIVYLTDNSKSWTYADQQEWVRKLLKNFNIDEKELDEVMRTAPSEDEINHIDTSGYRFGED
jgi:hypothetical protein